MTWPRKNMGSRLRETPVTAELAATRNLPTTPAGTSAERTLAYAGVLDAFHERAAEAAAAERQAEDLLMQLEDRDERRAAREARLQADLSNKFSNLRRGGTPS